MTKNISELTKRTNELKLLGDNLKSEIVETDKKINELMNVIVTKYEGKNFYYYKDTEEFAQKKNESQKKEKLEKDLIESTDELTDKTNELEVLNELIKFNDAEQFKTYVSNNLRILKELNQLKTLIKDKIYIKKYSSNYGTNLEKPYYEKLTNHVYQFHTPNILTLIGNCSLGIISIQANRQFLHFVTWIDDFNNPFFNRIPNPFTDDVYKIIKEQKTLIEQNNQPKDFRDITAIEKTADYIGTYINTNIQFKEQYEHINKNDIHKLKHLISNKLEYPRDDKPNQNMSFDTYISYIDSFVGLYNDLVYSFLFQIVYTINIFTQIGLVHQDMHLSNILVANSDETYDYYYVTDSKIANVKSKYLPLIFDFDLTTSADNIYKYGWTSNITNKSNINTKFDLKFFLHYLMGYVSDDNIKKCINKILYNIDNSDTNQKEIIDSLPISNAVNTWKQKMSEADLTNIEHVFNLCMTPNNALTYLCSTIKDNNYIKVYDNLSVIPLTVNSKIFFPPKTDMKMLYDQISQNKSWEQFNDNQKIIICNPLANLNLQYGGYGTDNNINYVKKYMKYKHKYLKLKYT